MGLAMALSDHGEPMRARDILEAVTEEYRHEAKVIIPSGYLHRADKAFVLAISEYDLLLSQHPEHAAALRGKAQALRGLFLPRKALKLAKQHPGILNEREIIRLESDAVALDLRDAIESPDERYPFPKINKALNEIDDRLSTEDPAGELATRLHHDRIVGLVAAHRREEAIADYEALDQVPAFVHSAAGRAYLDLRQPELARNALLQGEKLAPNDLELKISLFYALIELEHFDDAFALLQSAQESLVAVNQVDNSKVSQPSSVRMRVDIISAISLAYADQMAEAQSALEQIITAAPNNAQARYELANVYRWRGWPRRAQPQYQQITGRFPEHEVAARTANIFNNIDLVDLEEITQDVGNLVATHPSTIAVLDLQRDWRNHNRSQLLINASRGNSSGNNFGSEQFTLNAQWFSKPIKTHSRVYVRSFDSWAEFPQDNHARRRAGVGGEFKKAQWLVHGELNADRQNSSESGGLVGLSWRLNDYWLFSGVAEINSYSTPLRAHRANIDSDLLQMNARYQHSESWFVNATLGIQDFDDGNTLTRINLSGSYRLINGQKYKLDGYGYLGTSKSPQKNTPYFNPETSFEATLGVRNIWRQFRKYDHSITHRLGIDLGNYSQQGFGSGVIYTLDYEFDWQISARIGLKLGAQRVRRS
jgi:biofilm PGA synthesis protein PgaA